MSIGEDSVNGHPDTTAYIAVRKSDGTFVLLQGTDAGSYATIASDSPGLRITKTDQAVVNNTNEDFSITEDVDGNDLPATMNIKAVIVIPHNGAAPPAAVSTKWQLQLFSHSGRGVDDVIYNDDRTGVAASRDPRIDTTKWSFVNEEGNGTILGNLAIPNAENDATFTVKIIFS